MANNNNPDLVYLKSRDDLLPYEDARLNSLLQSVANFYTTRNDQSLWGNFLRALAIELAKIDYAYSYDLVNKDPQFLTPSDIRRRWADPLYVSSNWPSPTQFDLSFKLMLVELIAAYRMGTTVAAIQDVIFAYTGIQIKVIELYKEIGNGIFDQSDRNSISVSVVVGNSGSNPLTTVTSLAQLQVIVQSLYNAIALAKPAHVGLDFTTVFGESEDLDCILTPTSVTQEQFVLLPTTTSPFFTQTGWALINPVVFWEASTATSNPWEINTVLRDNNGNLQLALNAGKPGTIQPTWGLTSNATTVDNQITWKNISPQPTLISLTSNVVTVTVPNIFTVGASVALVDLAFGDNFSFLNYTPSSKITLTVTSSNETSFTANFVHPDVGLTAQTQGTVSFVPAAQINLLAYQVLSPTYQSLYQELYSNTNCQSTGITDTLRIFVKQIEASPYGPMLIQAPVLDPKNPKTTIAAYGRLLSPQLTATAWAALPQVFVNINNGMSDGTNATYSYVPVSQFLHEGEVLTITGFSNPALNVTGSIKDVVNLASQVLAVSVTANVVTISSPNSFAPGMLVTFSGLTNALFLNGQSLVIQAANPISYTVNFTHANYSKTADTGNGEVSTFQMPNNNTVTLEVPSPIIDAGLLSPTLQSAYYLANGVYVLGAPPIAVVGSGIGSSWVPSSNVFQGQIVVDANGNQQFALSAGLTGTLAPTWNADVNGSTTDNSVTWRNVGRNTFSSPNTWVGILNFSVLVSQGTPQPFSGEVGNWDSLHQYGLVAPRLNAVWEISGQPQDESFIFGLY